MSSSLARAPKKTLAAFSAVSNPFEATPRAWRLHGGDRRLAGCFPGTYDDLCLAAYWRRSDFEAAVDAALQDAVLGEV